MLLYYLIPIAIVSFFILVHLLSKNRKERELNLYIKEAKKSIKKKIQKGKIKKCVYCGNYGKERICPRCLSFLKKEEGISKSEIKFLKSIAEKPLGYRDLMDKLSLSRERVRQIKKKLMRKNLIREKRNGLTKFELNPKKNITRIDRILKEKKIS